MSVIDLYLVTDTVHRAKKEDGFRGTEYEAERTIKTRWNPKNRLVSNAAGEQIASDTSVESLAKVKVGDTLRDPEDGTDWPVIGVQTYYELDGTVSFYESYL